MNTEPQETVDRFIDLRAQGWSFNRISAELGVCRNTLIAWSRKHCREIQNLRELQLDAVAESCRINRAACLEQLSEDARRIREELAKRDFNEIPTTRLLTMASLLRTEITRLAAPVRLSQEIRPCSSEDYPNPSVDWQA